MATLDTRILLGAQPPQFDLSRIESPVNQMAAISQLQGAAQANQLRALQIDAARREEAAQNALSSAYQSALLPTGELDYEKLQRELASKGQGAQIPALTKARREEQKLQFEAQAAKNKLITEKLALSRDALDRIDPTAPDAAQKYLAWHTSNHADPVLGPYLTSLGVTQNIAFKDINKAVTSGKLPELIQMSKVGATRMQELRQPKLVARDAHDRVEIYDENPQSGTYSLDKPVRVIKKGTTEHEKVLEGQGAERVRLEGARVGLEGKRLSLEDRRVAMQEEANRLAKDPVHQAKLERARKEGELAAKDAATAQQLLPKIETVAQTTLDNIDAMIGKRDANGNLLRGQKVHPGFETAVGAGLPLRFIPGTNAADFQSRFDQIKGESFLQAFESLKGGGSITNIEGEKGTAAINRMSLAQSEKEFISAAKDLKDVIQKGLANARKRAEQARGGQIGGSAGALPPPPAGFRPD